jgi:hypothetical protein
LGFYSAPLILITWSFITMKSKQLKRIGALARLEVSDIKDSKMYRNYDPLKGSTDDMRVLLDEFRAQKAAAIIALQAAIARNA